MHRLPTSLSRVIALLALLLGPAAATAYAETLTLIWDRNPEPDVAGYVVYVGNSPSSYSQRIDVGLSTSYAWTANTGERYCFTVSAYSAGPVEGPRSPEVCTIDGVSNYSPTLANPGAQSSPLGAPATLALSATDPDGGLMTFSATGLPPGLTLAAQSGTISGSPTQAGTFTVRATVSDGSLSSSVQFAWTVTSSVPLAPTLVGPTGTLSTTTPTFEWQAVLTATSYRLWVDDSSATNPRLQVDLSPTQAGCASATVCRHSPGAAMAAGPGSWSVRATNSAGDGPWSGAMDFSIKDTSAPTVTITAPTAAVSFAAATASVTVAGTTSDNVGVVDVRWTNSRGGSGVASGTALAWSVPALALQVGSNLITITVRDAAGNQATDTITVDLADRAPSVAIAAPTVASTFTTTSATLALSGSASDDTSVSRVTWANDRGGSGTAAGTAAWSVTGVTLQSGTNRISATATDASGKTASAMLTVTYNPPTSSTSTTTPTSTTSTATTAAPTVRVMWPATSTVSTTAGTMYLVGSATGTNLVSVSWVNDRGGSGFAYGTAAYWLVRSVSLAVGTNTVTVTARDKSGRTGSTVLRLTRTSTTPTATSTTTVAGSTGTAPVSSVTTTPTTTTTTTAKVTTTTATVTTVAAPAPAPTPISLSIASPTAGSVFTSSQSTVALRGVASDNVVRVTWSVDWGGTGTASGTQTWSIPTVGLRIGSNTITVVAYDAAGKSQSKVLTVTYQPTPGTGPTPGTAY